MTTKTEPELAVTACPDCGHRIALKGRAELGRRLTCLHCGAELKVTGTEPLKVARAFSQ